MDVRFLSLGSGLLLESVAGSSYAFSVYSTDLKASLNYTQAEIQTVGSTGNVGLYVAFMAGLVYDAVGPLPVALIGAAFSGVGYALLWSASAGRTPTGVGAVSFYSLLWSFGSSWLDTCAVVTGVRNFPNDKGMVMGLTKSLFGLSASILTLAYAVLFDPHVDRYLLFCTVLIPLVALMGSAFIRLASPTAAAVPLTLPQRRRLSFGYGGVIALVIYLTIVSALVKQNTIPLHPVYAYLLVPLIAAQVAIILPWSCCRRQGGQAGGEGAAISATGNDATSPKSSQPLMLEGPDGLMMWVPQSLNDTASEYGGALDDTAMSLAYGTGVVCSGNYTGASPASGNSVSSYLRAVVKSAARVRMSGATLLQAACSLDFIVFFVILFFTTGAGLTVINNLANMSQSLSGQTDRQELFIVLLSVFNCLGRMFFGSASDATAQWMSRPAWITAAAASMGVCMLMSAFATWDVLYLTAMWTGFSYGGFFSLGPSFIGERFGTRALGSVLSLSALSTAAASYALSAGMSSAIYTANIHGTGTVCYGPDCYRATFFILAAMNGVAVLGGVWLVCRLRRTLYCGKGGQAVEYAAFIAAVGHEPHVTRLQSCLAPLCCCKYGRSLVVEEGEGHGTITPLLDPTASMGNVFDHAQTDNAAGRWRDGVVHGGGEVDGRSCGTYSDAIVSNGSYRFSPALPMDKRDGQRMGGGGVVVIGSINAGGMGGGGETRLEGSSAWGTATLSPIKGPGPLAPTSRATSPWRTSGMGHSMEFEAPVTGRATQGSGLTTSNSFRPASHGAPDLGGPW